MASPSETTLPAHARDGAINERISTSSHPDITGDRDGPTHLPADQKDGTFSRTSHASEMTNHRKMLNLMQSQHRGARRPLTAVGKSCGNFADDPLIRPLQLPVMSNSRLSVHCKLTDAAFQIPVRHEDPDQLYEPMLYLGTNKSVIMGLSRVHPFRCVQAIKQRSIMKTIQPPDFMWDLSHPSIAKVREAFYHQGGIFTVYDFLELSLESLQAIPVTIEEQHVASIALQVLQGLSCIESAFQRQRGFITASTILFAKDGRVKIGSVADALQLSEPRDADTDTKVLGELLENLRKDWLFQARAFFDAAKLSSCDELLKYDFIANAPAPTCLQRYVNIAAVAFKRQWKLAERISSRD